MSKQISGDLDQVVNIYRSKLRQVGTLWSQLVRHGQCDTGLMKSAYDMVDQMETASRHLLEELVLVETVRFHVRNFRQMLDVSRQIVEAKSQHLKTEEQQMERERCVRYKEFQRIHKIQEERASIEKNTKPAREKMTVLMDTLAKKCIKQNYLEDFAWCLTEELSKDLRDIKAQTEAAREKRNIWDKNDVDVYKELSQLITDDKKIASLRKEVMDLKDNVQNQNKWYEEELRTKLFYSSRNKELKNKIANFRATIKRIERAGRCENWGESPRDNNRPLSTLDDFSTSIMLDGLPDIHAKEVEDYLSQKFGVKVLADYSMLRRLKDEIGVLGLAYLVERIRFQDHFPGERYRGRPSFKDLEVKQIELALETIAKEYRIQEGSPHHVTASRMTSQSQPCCDQDTTLNEASTLDLDPSLSCTASPLRCFVQDGFAASPSGISTPTGSFVAGFGGGTSHDGSHCSTGSIRSKTSLSRIKKLFKR